MAESSMYSSLLALVDSHLSKTSLEENTEDVNTTSLNKAPLNNLRNGSVSDSLLPLHDRPRIPIPNISTSESPIQSILAKQVANMLKAKEKKQQDEENKKKEYEIKRRKLEDEKNSVIDLMKAIETPYSLVPRPNLQETISSSSSTESLFKIQFDDCDSEPERANTPEPTLACIMDLSYILREKVKMGKCSVFGKILSSKLKPVAAPYLMEETKIPTNIVRFDFSTPSPCDIIKANLRKPTMSSAFTVDITKFV